jgi:hypothetical protein
VVGVTDYRLDVYAVYQANPLHAGYFQAANHDEALAVARAAMAVLGTDAELHDGGLWTHLELQSSQDDYVADVDFTGHVHGSWGAVGRCAGCGIEQQETTGEGWADLAALLLVHQEGPA